MKMDNCIYLKKNHSDDDTIIAIDKTKLKTIKLSEAFDKYGNPLGNEYACDYSLLNSVSNAESDLINAISNKFNIDASLVNIQAHGSGNSMSFTIQEGDGEKYGFNEEKVNEFIQVWRKENEVFTECEAYTFWNGSNFRTIIVSCDLYDFPLDYKQVYFDYEQIYFL